MTLSSAFRLKLFVGYNLVIDLNVTLSCIWTTIQLIDNYTSLTLNRLSMTSSLITSLIVVHFLSQALIGSFNLLSRADKEL